MSARDDAVVADALAVLTAASRAIEKDAQYVAVFATFVNYMINHQLSGLAFDVPLTSGDRRIKIELVDE